MTRPLVPKPALSSPFAHREFNGDTLLAEVQLLREAQVRQANLMDCAQAVRRMYGLRVSQAHLKLRELAGGRFSSQPALASLLVRWGARLKTEADVDALMTHFQRLVIAAALIGGMRRAEERYLSEGGN